MSACSTVSEIFSVKEWRDLQIVGRGLSRSLKMAPFDRPYTTLYWSAIVNSSISSLCFYWLHQIRKIRRSLDAESAKTLVHAFITSRIEGCNTVLAGSPRTITDRLQRLLNAAARVVSNAGKFDRGLTHLLHSELHWLDVPQQILHKLRVTVHRCLQGKAPQ